MSSVNWETVGNDGKAIKKVGVGKVDAKKEAAAKKKFQEKAPKLQDFRKIPRFKLGESDPSRLTSVCVPLLQFPTTMWQASILLLINHAVKMALALGQDRHRLPELGHL